MKIYLATEVINNLPDFIDIDLRNLHYSVAKKTCYDIVRDENNSEKSILVDSPYTLYTFNNCMLRLVVDDHKKFQEYKHRFSEIPLPNSPIEFYSINSLGEILKISGERGVIKDSNIEIAMKELMDDFYNLLTFY